MKQLARRAAFALPLSLVGCDRKGPRATADRFLDRYYIDRDHAAALQLSGGAVAERLRAEKALLEGGGGGGPQPRVYYSLKGERPVGEGVELTYGLTLDAAGMKLSKEVRLLVVAQGEGHRVISLQERDLVER